MAIIDWCPEPDGYVDLSIFGIPLIIGMFIGFLITILYLRKRKLKSSKALESGSNSSYTQGENK